MTNSKDTQEKTVRHVAIIMDGNNRWAKKRLLPGVAGHKAGEKAVRKAVEYAVENGLEVLTLFAFSSENWQRPKAEVDALMDLFLNALKKQVDKAHERNIRVRIMGEVSGFSENLQTYIKQAEEKTAANTGLTLVVAANYGGQWDIVNAAKLLARDVEQGKLTADQIDQDAYQRYIQNADLPAVDLCIRTSGEQRISNFMLWQMAYAEFYFDPVLWPDFDHQHFADAIDAFYNRERRYGGRNK